MGKRKMVVPKGWGSTIRKMKSNLKTYKERRTPKNHYERKGILERKNDFLYRIRKKQQKESEEKYYRVLVENKNPVEYNFDMKYSEKDWASGKTVVREFEKMEKHLRKKKKRKLIKETSNQNVNLLRMKLSIIQKNIAKLKNDLPNYNSYNTKVKVNKHIFFVKKKKKNMSNNNNNIPKIRNKRNDVSRNNEEYSMEFEKLKKMMEREEFLKNAIMEIEMARKVSLKKDEIDSFEYYDDEEEGSKILVGNLKHVKYVNYKDQRKR